MPKPKSKFTYDPVAKRYRDSKGRFVDRVKIRQALDSALRNASSRVARLSDQLRMGKISLISWERDMRDALKDVHLYSRALGRGGWDRMTQADFGAVGNALRKQYTYLNRFAAEISQGLPFDGRFTLRTQMYVGAARRTYYDALDQEMADAGMTQQRNVLSSAEHCAGCLDETARGWVMIGQLVPIGERDCITNCKCFIEYR